MMPPDHAFSSVTPVILAGGAGRRLYPLSTQKIPKPFIKFPFAKETMLQQTAQRVSMMRPPVIICNARHRERAVLQMKECNVTPARILLEPAGRNTAPAIAAAAHYLSRDPDTLMLVLPSDHAVKNPQALLAAIEAGIPLARQGRLVLFGIKPDSPHTSYGYIEAQGGDVTAFHEKPNRARAAALIRQGCYWNSGIFLFSPQAILGALQQHAPEICDAAHEAVNRAAALRESVILADSFASMPAQSIDRAVMERADHLAFVPVAAPGWRDLGTWGALLSSLLRG